jgi:hypothetical protein
MFGFRPIEFCEWLNLFFDFFPLLSVSERLVCIIQTRSDDAELLGPLLLNVDKEPAAAVDPAEFVGSMLTNAGSLTDKLPMSSIP